MSWLWILLAVVAQPFVMAIFSWSTPVLLYWYPSVTNLAMYHRRPFDCLCFQRSAGVLGRLSLVRKNTSKTFKKTLHFIRTPIFYLSCSSYTLYHPFKRTFVRGIQSALTVTYFHYDWRLDWTTLKWTGLEGTVLHYIGLSSATLDFPRLHLTAVPWIEKESTIQYSSSLHFTGLICLELHCTFPDAQSPKWAYLELSNAIFQALR